MCDAHAPCRISTRLFAVLEGRVFSRRRVHGHLTVTLTLEFRRHLHPHARRALFGRDRFAASIAVIHIPRWTVAACSAALRVDACPFAVASAVVAQALVRIFATSIAV